VTDGGLGGSFEGVAAARIALEPGPAVAMVALFVVSLLGLGSLLVAVWALTGEVEPAEREWGGFSPPLVLTLVHGFSAWLALRYARRQLGVPWSELWAGRRASLAAAGGAVALQLGTSAVLLGMMSGLFAAWSALREEALAQAWLFDVQRFPWSVPVLGVVAAPVLEEAVFRGVMLRGLLAHTSPAKAIAASTVAFGLVHFALTQVFVALALGVLLGVVYYRTGSLGLCIGLHALHNALAIYVFAPVGEAVPAGTWVLGGVAVLLLAGWWFARRTFSPVPGGWLVASSVAAAPPLLGEPPVLTERPGE
jgi:membrane protease YdiL (CAAX protease family)